MITVIPPSEFKTIPWKNGKGQTIELAINKEGTLEDFDWRLSMAQVTENGPFSDFSGYWRHLVLIEGEDITLTHDSDVRHHLRAQLQVASFDGGSHTEAALGAGPITDFNIITRQASFQTEVITYQDDHSVDINVENLMFIYGLKGALNISTKGDKTTLPEGQLMVIEELAGSTISVHGSHWIIANLQQNSTSPIATHDY